MAALSVRWASGQEVVSLDSSGLRAMVANHGDSIKALKRYLHTFCEVSIYRMKLVHHGQMMSDNDLLSDVPIPADLSLIVCDTVPPSVSEARSFLRASWRGHAEVLESLIRKGINPNCIVSAAKTWMEHHTQQDMAKRMSPLSIASFQGHLECVQLLLEANASPDDLTMFGETPLWLACQRGHAEVARLLVSAGASLNHADRDGVSPLFSSCSLGDVETARLLL